MSTSSQYTYPKPSTTATRALVSPNSTSTQPTSTEQPNNYETVAATAANSGSLPPTTAASVAAASASAPTDRPGVQRQQSWKMSDFKGQQQGQMLAGKVGGQGYSSTTTGSSVQK